MFVVSLHADHVKQCLRIVNGEQWACTTVHGKIFEGEIFGKGNWRGKFWQICWQSISYSTVFIYNGKENLANYIPFAKFAKIFPLQNFPMYGISLCTCVCLCLAATFVVRVLACWSRGSLFNAQLLLLFTHIAPVYPAVWGKQIPYCSYMSHFMHGEAQMGPWVYTPSSMRHACPCRASVQTLIGFVQHASTLGCLFDAKASRPVWMAWWVQMASTSFALCVSLHLCICVHNTSTVSWSPFVGGHVCATQNYQF